jgi:hypothetical protein
MVAEQGSDCLPREVGCSSLCSAKVMRSGIVCSSGREWFQVMMSLIRALRPGFIRIELMGKVLRKQPCTVMRSGFFVDPAHMMVDRVH